MTEINGNLSAKGMKIALVVSRFNSFLTEQLVKGAVDAFTRLLPIGLPPCWVSTSARLRTSGVTGIDTPFKSPM